MAIKRLSLERHASVGSSPKSKTLIRRNISGRKLSGSSLYWTTVYLIRYYPQRLLLVFFGAQQIGPEVGLPVSSAPLKKLTPSASLLRGLGRGFLRAWRWTLLLLLLLLEWTVGHHVGHALTEMALFGLGRQLTLFGVMARSSAVVASM